MNEAVERAARAAYEQFYNSGWPPRVFDAELRTADDWRRMAKAAILTLREPSEAMVEAGKRVAINLDSTDMAKAWQAMLDEAAR